MIIEAFDRIEAVEELWKKLYSDNDNLSFYQSYEWNLNLQKKFYSRRITRGFGCKLAYFVIDGNFIAPLVIDKRHSSATLLGQNESSDYLSFIFSSNETKETIIEKIKNLVLKLGLKDFYISRINQSSFLKPIFDLLAANDENWILKGDAECVSVKLDRDCESFYSTLSKSVRQNYRTGLNRLKQDGKEFRVNMDYMKFSSKKSEELLAIYKQRRTECDVKTLKQKAVVVIHNIIKYISGEKYFDILTGYSKQKPVFFAEAVIDGKTAAFCIGDINTDQKSISISRVATSEEFYRYSAGMLMFIDILDILKEHITDFDLTRGDEDYKYKLGGKVHLNYSYQYKLK